MVTDIHNLRETERKPVYPFIAEFLTILGLFIIFPIAREFDAFSLYAMMGIGIGLLFRIIIYFVDTTLFTNKKMYIVLSSLMFTLFVLFQIIGDNGPKLQNGILNGSGLYFIYIWVYYNYNNISTIIFLT